ncbi:MULTISPECIES: helix-turn-helix transcriptional regulator [Pseudomonas syringae group]|uniref:helix-turn-helix transcriptional regulator n=1 Tax=Pseudomonas syringae group TaxID=136849 RepID=UPI000F3EED79|nr:MULTISPECIES: helix-turn-helix transcriptional regulator [Pseudomonas syringae group]RMN31894.1 Syringofactin operon regulator SyfR [Pseudomonas coronafaciens pv. zizaniae]
MSCTGCATFAGQMHELANAQVPVHGIDLSEWTLDLCENDVIDIKVLGTAGLQQELPAALNHPLLPSILHMQDPRLIQLKSSPSKQHPQRSTHQCNLVSSSADRRRVICFHRLMTERAFSLAELSVLKSLSDMLLPLLGQHAQSLAQQASLQDTGSETEAGSLDPVFSIKLAQEAVTLSAREQEVCIGLLTGGTVSQMAQRLKVKNSSVDTYLKRATAKLGVSGRHGLARWIAER